MKQLIALLVALIFAASPVFAKPKEGVPGAPGKTGVDLPAPDKKTTETGKSIGKAVDKVQAEAVDAVVDELLGEEKKTTTKVVKTEGGTKVPPGLAKKDKMPPGLEKQGKTPPGWEKGEKTTVVTEVEEKPSLVRRFVRKIFGEKKEEDAAKKE